MADHSQPPLTQQLFGSTAHRAAVTPPTALPRAADAGATSQRRAIQPDSEPEHADSAPATAERAAVAMPRAAFPQTLNLPAIPVDRPRRTGLLRGERRERALPVTRPPTLPPVAAAHVAGAVREMTAPYEVVVMPGAGHSRALRERRGAPKHRSGANQRMSRFVLAGMLLTLCLAVIAIAPLSKNHALPLFDAWGAQANGFDIPTATPVPPPVYVAHPYASGANAFICVALPFARLAQQKMRDAGIQHPWYVSLILAQWGFEQGWQVPSYTGYNWGNVGAVAGFPTIGGTAAWGSPSAFAYAYTGTQGVDMYVQVANNGYYNAVAANYGNGPRAEALALGESPWDAGHYGESGGGPGATLISIMNSFNLYRFDNPSVGC